MASHLLNQNEAFSFKRRVTFYETDAMAVVHHSNYVRYLEDARVEWMRQSGLLAHHAPQGEFVFAVHELSVSYKRPLKFDDQMEIWMQAKIEGVRIRIQYAVEKIISESTFSAYQKGHIEASENGAADKSAQSDRILVATGKTVLIPLDSNFTPVRLPAEARAIFKASKWSDEWPH